MLRIEVKSMREVYRLFKDRKIKHVKQLNKYGVVLGDTDTCNILRAFVKQVWTYCRENDRLCNKKIDSDEITIKHFLNAWFIIEFKILANEKGVAVMLFAELQELCFLGD